MQGQGQGQGLTVQGQGQGQGQGLTSLMTPQKSTDFNIFFVYDILKKLHTEKL